MTARSIELAAQALVNLAERDAERWAMRESAGPPVATRNVRAWTHPTLTEDNLNLCWEDLVTAVRRRSDWYDDHRFLEEPRTEDSINGDVDAALWPLLHGEVQRCRRCRRTTTAVHSRPGKREQFGCCDPCYAAGSDQLLEALKRGAL